MERRMISRHYVLAAGGTGGHMMPAHALAEELIARGHRVALITDDRGSKFPGLFDGAQPPLLPAGHISGGPIGWLRHRGPTLAGRDLARRVYDQFPPERTSGG